MLLRLGASFHFRPPERDLHAVVAIRMGTHLLGDRGEEALHAAVRDPQLGGDRLVSEAARDERRDLTLAGRQLTHEEEWIT
jgi:hypothetical protein